MLIGITSKKCSRKKIFAVVIMELQDRKTKRQIGFSCPNLFQHFQLLVIRNIEFSDMGINSYRNGSKRAEYEALTALNGASMVVWNGNLKEKMGPFEGNG